MKSISSSLLSSRSSSFFAIAFGCTLLGCSTTPDSPGPIETEEALFRALPASEWNKRLADDIPKSSFGAVKAVVALSSLDAHAEESVLRLLRDRDVKVREVTTEAIGEVDGSFPESVAAALVGMLNDGDGDVQYYVVPALVRFDLKLSSGYAPFRSALEEAEWSVGSDLDDYLEDAAWELVGPDMKSPRGAELGLLLAQAAARLNASAWNLKTLAWAYDRANQRDKALVAAKRAAENLTSSASKKARAAVEDAVERFSEKPF